MKRALIIAAAILAVFLIYAPVNAHPGNTTSDGCHYCRTNCDYWGVAWDTRHCHNSTPTPAPTPAPVYKPTITTKTETKSEEIPFETKNQDDPNLEEGKTAVKQEGVNGVRTLTYTVTYTDGKEANRAKTGESVTKEPVPKIVLNGTKKAETAAPVENKQEVKGQVAGEQENPGPVAILMAFLIVFGIPAGIIWLVIRKLRKRPV